MGDDLRFAAMPAVLDDDENPFVIGFVDDPRPAIDIGGALYRRGQTGYSISWPTGELWLRARALAPQPGLSVLVASVGPMLDDWWPLLRSAPEDPARPLLSAGVARRKVEVALPPPIETVGVGVVPSTDDYPHTVVMYSRMADIANEENLLLFHWASVAVVRTALRLLVEYQGLVGEPPDVDVVLGEDGRVTLPLASVLETAAQITAVLDGQA